jgi:hypothetical protein
VEEGHRRFIGARRRLSAMVLGERNGSANEAAGLDWMHRVQLAEKVKVAKGDRKIPEQL